MATDRQYFQDYYQRLQDRFNSVEPLLPDIPVSLGPSRENRKTRNLDSNENDPVKFPRIVLKDKLGNKLDTFTTLQDALYR